MSRKRYNDETKAAVMAALLAGQSVSQVAEDYEIPIGTISSWYTKIKNGTFSNFSEQKKEIGELLIAYLYANLETLRTQTEFFRDPKWLEVQSAADLAVLHGVMTDKTVRLLEAFGNASRED